MTFQSLPSIDGEFSVSVYLQDDGGAYLGGQDKTSLTNITIFIYQPYTISVSPDAGGVSLQSTFTVTLEGGTVVLNSRGVFVNMYYALQEKAGTPSVHPKEDKAGSTLFRRRTQYWTYVTRAIPSGFVTIWAEVYDSRGVLVGTPMKTVSVQTAPATVPLSSTLSSIESAIVADYEGSVLSMLAASDALSSVASPQPFRTKLFALLDSALAHRKLLSGALTEPEVLTFFMTVKNLFAANDIPARPSGLTPAPTASTTARRRSFQQQQDPTTAPSSTPTTTLVPMTAIEEATDFLQSVMLQADSTVAFRVKTLDEIVTTCDLLMHAAAQYESPIWQSKEMRDRALSVHSQMAEQNQRVVDVLMLVMRMMHWDCQRQQMAATSSGGATSSPSPSPSNSDVTYGTLQSAALVKPLFIPAGDADVVSQADSLFVPLAGSAVSFASTISTGGAAMCTVLLVIQRDDVLLGTGDPALSPRYPPGVAGHFTRRMNESLLSATVATQSFSVMFPFLVQLSAADIIAPVSFRLELFTGSSHWEALTDATRTQNTMKFQYARSSALVASSSFKFVGVGVVNIEELTPPYPVILLPILVGLLVVGLVVSKATEGSPTYRPHNYHGVEEQVVFLVQVSKSKGYGYHFLRSHTLFALFFQTYPFSSHTRSQRFACLLTSVTLNLLFATVTQSAGVKNDAQQGYLQEATVDVGRMALVTLGAAAAASLCTWCLEYLFTAKDVPLKIVHFFKLPKRPDPNVVAAHKRALASAGESGKILTVSKSLRCLCFSNISHLAWIVFVVLFLAAGTIIGFVAWNFKTTRARNENWQAFLFAVGWTWLVMETLKCGCQTFLYKQRVAKYMGQWDVVTGNSTHSGGVTGPSGKTPLGSQAFAHNNTSSSIHSAAPPLPRRDDDLWGFGNDGEEEGDEQHRDPFAPGSGEGRRKRRVLGDPPPEPISGRFTDDDFEMIGMGMNDGVLQPPPTRAGGPRSSSSEQRQFPRITTSRFDNGDDEDAGDDDEDFEQQFSPEPFSGLRGRNNDNSGFGQRATSLSILLGGSGANGNSSPSPPPPLPALGMLRNNSAPRRDLLDEFDTLGTAIQLPSARIGTSVSPAHTAHHHATSNSGGRFSSFDDLLNSQSPPLRAPSHSPPFAESQHGAFSYDMQRHPHVDGGGSGLYNDDPDSML